MQTHGQTLDFLPRAGALSRLDARAIESLASLRWSRSDFGTGDAIEPKEGISILSAGWAGHYRELPNRSRQMVSLLLPGDVCDFAFLTGRVARLPLTALSPVAVWTLSIETFLSAGHACHSVISAVLAAMETDHAIVEEHLITIGSLSAIERLSRWLLELQFRLDPVNPTFDLPLSQARIGEYLCLSSVHVNRTFQALRRLQVIETRGKRLSIIEPERLAAIGSFSSAYLAPDDQAHSGRSHQAAVASSLGVLGSRQA
ncbi:hypothetical protein VW35_16965 [Devosia soli]|uniref:HTH crp-type domain-containing protein n=2 Tax=Devosia soli TaxID=361041 RepID=A0A0F5L2Q6_9HYPH|nr:hypothetical protein VW35_16965 [Devosia soli]